MASGGPSENTGLSRNRNKYPSKIDGTATYSKYYNILDNCVNHSYAKKCKAKGKNKWKMKMKSRGKEKKWTFFFIILYFILFLFYCEKRRVFSLRPKGAILVKLRELKNLVPVELMEIILWATKEARHLFLVSGREGPGVEFKACLLITFASQAHVIPVHKYCTKWETFQFALPAWNLFTQENESRAWFKLTSAGQVFDKIRMLAKSRNRCKLSSFRFNFSAKCAWSLYFYTFPNMLRRLSSESFNEL